MIPAVPSPLVHLRRVRCTALLGLGLGLVLLLASASAPARAQSPRARSPRAQPPPTQPTAEAAEAAEATEAARADGRLRVLVFDLVTEAQVPLATVEAGGEEVMTNIDGAAVLTLPPGAYRLVVEGGGYTPALHDEVPVTAGAVTEALVWISRESGPSIVEVEAPALAVAVAEDAATGTVRGRISHVDTGEPVEEARVFVRGTRAEARTDAEGRFVIEVPAGEVDLSVIHPDFGTTSRSVSVEPGENTQVAFVLTPTAVELAALRITAPRVEGTTLSLTEERRASGSVMDFVGAEQMSRSGDANAAAALSRVTGITVVDGKYVFVRGLGDRYASALLNASHLPSPEPERRVVPLDMFEADLLESVVVQKSYTPDLPGEFGGGAVMLRTRPYSEVPQLEMAASTGAVMGTTFAPGLVSPGGPTDFLGFDAGHRALPDAIQAASDDQALAERDRFSDRGYTAQELERFGEMMPNVWTPEEADILPKASLGLNAGTGFTLGGRKGGVLASLTWDNDVRTLSWTEQFTTLSGGELEPSHHYDFEETVRHVTLAGMLTGGIDLDDDNRLRLTSLVDRITDDGARTYQGFNRDVSGDIRVSRLRWVERTLLFNQLRGEHADLFGPLDLQWRYALSVSTRYEPDRREVRYDANAGSWILSDRPEGNQRVFSDLLDVVHDLAVDTAVPLTADDKGLTLKSGVAAMVKNRSVDTRRFKFIHKGPDSSDISVLSQSPEQIFQDAYIDSQGFQFQEITRPTDNYTADWTLFGGYVMADTPLFVPRLRLVAGARIEASTQRVRTFELFSANPQVVPAELSTVDVLPSAIVSFDLPNDMLLRGALARTVNRPEFRELSPATFNDVTGGRQVFGNPDLDRAGILNVDARWEWYPSPGESLSAGAFYKHFTRPIESIVQVSAQHTVTYANARSAENVGVEVDFRRTLEFLSPSLSAFWVAGNGALISSRVNLPDEGIQTSDERALQGQSPWVLNLQAGWEDLDSGAGVSVLFSALGRRIREVGALGAPDVYELPPESLDVVVKWPFENGLTLGFKAQNLLDPAVERVQGDVTTSRVRYGRSFSLGISKAL